MSFVSDVLPLIGSLIAIVVILYLTYLGSKYVSKKMALTSSNGSIQVLERIALAQDKLLIIVCIDKKYYLLGVANNSINILKELEDYTPPEVDMNLPEITIFKDLLKKVNKDK